MKKNNIIQFFTFIIVISLYACSGSGFNSPEAVGDQIVSGLKAKSVVVALKSVVTKSDVEYMMEKSGFPKTLMTVAKSEAERMQRNFKNNMDRQLKESDKLGIDWNKVKLSGWKKSKSYTKQGLTKIDKIVSEFSHQNNRYRLTISDIMKAENGWVFENGAVYLHKISK